MTQTMVKSELRYAVDDMQIESYACFSYFTRQIVNLSSKTIPRDGVTVLSWVVLCSHYEALVNFKRANMYLHIC